MDVPKRVLIFSFAQGEQNEPIPEAHKPTFVKHLNKTRTMSPKQKWDWAFDKILMVSPIFF